MKVWFGCTTAQWSDYRENYFLIRDYLKDLGCVMLGDWIDEADDDFKNKRNRRDIHRIFNKIMRAIDDSDAVVIEYTVPNFSSSHQIHYALLKRKPTLVMRLYKDNPRFSDSYLEAVQSPNLTLRQYTKKNYQTILQEFVGISQIEQGQQRYNVVLDKRQKYFLDWASEEYGKSRSEIIRGLVDGEISKDKKYQKYIKVLR